MAQHIRDKKATVIRTELPVHSASAVPMAVNDTRQILPLPIQRLIMRADQLEIARVSNLSICALDLESPRAELAFS